MKTLPKLVVCAIVALLVIFCGSSLMAQGSNPVPFVNNPLVPNAAVPGGAGFTLTVNGTGFVSGSIVKWNGTAVATTFVNSEQLHATISAAQIANPGTASVTVVNPNPGGGTSNPTLFTVSSAASSLSFAESYSPTSGTQGMITADFNGDGKLDIAAVTDTNPNSVAVQLGNGDGSFQAATSYPISGIGGLNSIVAADFNGDGKLDIAALNSGDTATLSIFLGNGDGTFQSPTVVSVSPDAQYLAVGDFNGDGKLDLVTVNNNKFGLNNGNGLSSVSMLLGNGDGTFAAYVDYQVSASMTTTTGVAVGDFNGDGKLDVACATYNFNGGGPAQLSIFRGNGDGTFQTATSATITTASSSLTTADVDGDGKLDLITVTNGGTSAYVFLGNGDGTFQSGVSYPIGNGPAIVSVADMNADGKLDLVVASQLAAAVYVALGNGDGTFQSPVTIAADFPNSPSGGLTPTLAVGDFNGDGRTDLALVNSDTNNQPNDNLTVLLQGSFPAAYFSPLNLRFIDQALETSSAPETVTLNNSGNATMTLTGIAITGAAAADYAKTTTCGATLAAGANCQVSVTFTPSALGNRNAAVSFTNNGPGSPNAVALIGNTLPGGAAVLSPTSVSFPHQYVGTTGLPQSVTLTNSGTATLNITNIAASPSDFGVLSACGNSVAAGASCAIGVFFDPTVSGTRTGTLTVTNDGTGSPQTVSLTGMGQDFTVGASSPSASVSPGQSATYTVSVSPGGGFNGSVALSCAGAPALSTCSVSPGSVNLNGSTAASVQVTVTTAGSSVSPNGLWIGGPDRRGPFVVPVLAFVLWALILMARLVWGRDGRRSLRPAMSFAVLLLCIAFTFAASGCGGSSGGSTGTQAGTYSLTVSGNFSSGQTNLTHATSLTLTVH
jgi:VCBS repeat protein/HYDIN/CFA65/VesB family protein/FG-GAP repeat protein